MSFVIYINKTHTHTHQFLVGVEYSGNATKNTQVCKWNRTAKTYVMLNWHISCTATTFFVSFYCISKQISIKGSFMMSVCVKKFNIWLYFWHFLLLLLLKRNIFLFKHFFEPIHYCVFLHLNLFVLHFICPSIYPSVHPSIFLYTQQQQQQKMWVLFGIYCMTCYVNFFFPSARTYTSKRNDEKTAQFLFLLQKIYNTVFFSHYIVTYICRIHTYNSECECNLKPGKILFFTHFRECHVKWMLCVTFKGLSVCVFVRWLKCDTCHPNFCVALFFLGESNFICSVIVFDCSSQHIMSHFYCQIFRDVTHFLAFLHV